MPKKYHIDFKPTAPRYTPLGKSGVIDFREGCTRCRPCAKTACVYNVYENRSFDSSQMADSIDYLCKSCFRCVQSCKKGILTKSINPEYTKMGDAYWTPEIISTNWTQAETGKIPVSGAGYGGPFSGPGFDSMWTDMSEIVRPTRDGIHGREYISTAVDLGRKLDRLSFSSTGKLLLKTPPLLEIPLPMIMTYPPFGHVSDQVRQAMALAATKLGTVLVVKAEDFHDSLNKFTKHIIPQVSPESYAEFKALLAGHPAVEILYGDRAFDVCRELKHKHPHTIVIIKLPLDGNEVDIAQELAAEGAEVIHLYADDHGNEFYKTNPRFIKDMVRLVHLRLVERSLRDQVTLIASGGIAMAEHVAKIVICGADAVAIDVALLIALECRLCKNCEKHRPCPVTIDAIEPRWGAQRIINLMSAWRNQLLEVLGAMGIREMRRLRGEVGRAMFFEELEADIFGRMFGERV
jgi:ferredoxin